MEIDLHGTADAMVWAKEFVKTLQEHPDTADPHDVGFMVGWFANAIEAGRGAGDEFFERWEKALRHIGASFEGSVSLSAARAAEIAREALAVPDRPKGDDDG